MNQISKLKILDELVYSFSFESAKYMLKDNWRKGND
ncbi:hypothetical protein SAMN06295997_102148 [Malaciobacter marinus]|jgi:hypothetical protein|nr:hypothetical protein SAMN06295997_102148 [Malaciobacter marinus]